MASAKYPAGATLAANGIIRATRKGRPSYSIDIKRQFAALAGEPAISVAKLGLEHGINATPVTVSGACRESAMRLRDRQR